MRSTQDRSTDPPPSCSPSSAARPTGSIATHCPRRPRRSVISTRRTSISISTIRRMGATAIRERSSPADLVSLATGDGHFAPSTFELPAFGPNAGGWSSDDTYPREVADVNGDGKADIVGFASTGVFVSLATGDGHFAPSTFELPAFGPNAGGSCSDDTFPREVAVVNGDGKADIVGFASTGVFVSLATGDGHFAPSTFELPAFG